MLKFESVDAVICEEYAAVPYTADEIAGDPQLAERFCDHVKCQVATVAPMTIAAFNDRFLNLRRRDEEKGGLVRKRRRYGARNRKPT